MLRGMKSSVAFYEAEAKVLPFEMSLRGLYNILSIMNSSGWHYHENASEIEGLSWEVLHRCRIGYL
ncbi:unnamed protein product [Penicillium camemberti]|uniref:Str. FM013 n=1 Tax=Penicillium camemberti (strain FM 013) TaxID=1429867 RepID=A0A0G4P9F6_PENC3|nr:unnamed protein product [Penicillium camemberti]